MKQKTSMFLRRGVALALSAAILLGLTACGRKPAEIAPTEEPFTAQDALAYMDNYKENMNYENAASELSETHTTQISGDTYVRMQQYYQGIPVYGRTVVCAADENGEVTSVTGNLLDIDPTLDLTPTITLEQAEDSLRAYMTEEMGMELEADFSLSGLGELSIYTTFEPQALAYEVSFGTWKAIIDAHDAAILAAASSISMEQVWYTGPDGCDPVLGVEPIDGEYVLMDAARDIYVFNADKNIYLDTKSTPVDLFVWPENLNSIRSKDTKFGVKEGFFQKSNDSCDSSAFAFEFLNLLGKAKDYYALTLEENGEAILIGVYNDALASPNAPELDAEGNNSYASNDTLSKLTQNKLPVDHVSGDTRCALVGMGYAQSNNLDQRIDTIGHEYQHTIFGRYLTERSMFTAETRVINEAIADIMGELFEAEIRQTTQDWIHGERPIMNPDSNGHPMLYTDILGKEEERFPLKEGNPQLSTDFTHGASTVISHVAYLMWNGIDGTEAQKLSNNQLAELWYRAVLMMPNDCDFVFCRYLVEKASLDMDELTEAQRNCIRMAFDEAAIPSMSNAPDQTQYSLTDGEAILHFYTNDLQAYCDYTLTISGVVGHSDPSNSMIELPVFPYHSVTTVTGQKPVELKLCSGNYTFTVSNLNFEECYTFTVNVSSYASENQIRLVSAYGQATENSLSTESVTDAFTDVRMMKYGGIRCFHIPQINTEVCAEANEKIFDAEMDVLTDGFYDHWDSGIYKTFDFEFDPGLGSMGYLYGEKNGIVSILVCRGGTEFGSYYETYYVSTQSGEMLPVINMLEAYGMSEDEWKEKSEETLRKRWTEFAAMIEYLGESEVNASRRSTFSEENLADIKPFLLEDGSLAMVATIFTPAGDGGMTVILDVETGEEIYPVFCGEEHTEFTQEELITVEDATELAAQYWGFESVADLKKDGDLFIRYDDYTKKRVAGVLYYVIYLQCFVEIENEPDESSESTDPTETTEAPYVHLSTIDYVFVHTATGEIVIPEY